MITSTRSRKQRSSMSILRAAALATPAVLALVELVAGAISQQLLTNEVVSLREWAGGVLIIVGAYLAARAAMK